MKLKVILFYSVLIFNSHFLFGQSTVSGAPNVTLPSPNAAAFAKYGDFPVSTFTGLPDISIPIYTIKSGDITVPITLSYHGSGIRVEEESGWVGMNWTLNAAGVITRTIRGKDDFNGGYLSSPKIMDISCDSPELILNPCKDYNEGVNEDIIYNGFCGTNRGSISGIDFGYFKGSGTRRVHVDGEVVDYYNIVNPQDTDWEPDLYFFNFLGYSGKFVFDKDFFDNGKIHFLDKVPFTVELFEKNNNGISPITRASKGKLFWIITDEQGNKYYFGEGEAIDIVNDASIATGGTAINGWYLTKITSPKGNVVNFIYENESAYTPSVFNYEIEIVSYDAGLPFPKQYTKPSYYNTPYLKNIIFSNGYIDFQRSTTYREDLQNAKSLNSINVFQTNGSPLKSYGMVYSYYNPASGINNYKMKRLRLDQIIESNGNGLSLPPYKLTYYNTDINNKLLELPRKDSYSKDHWGYFNGRENTTSIPGYYGYYEDGSGTSKYGIFDGGNRETDGQKVLVGSLLSIQYPTGGITTFNFESNQFDPLNGYKPYQTDSFHEVNYGASRRIYGGNYSNTGGGYGNVPFCDCTFYEFNASSNAGCENGSSSYSYKNYNSDASCGSCEMIYTSSSFTVTDLEISQAFNVVLSTIDNQHITYKYYKNGVENYINQSGTYILSPGNYTLKVCISAGTPTNTGATMTFTRREKVSPNLDDIYLGGGLRIASITEYDGINHANDKTRNFKYDYVNGQGKKVSSGLMLTNLKYDRTAFILKSDRTGFGDGIGSYYERSSYSNIPMSNSANNNAIAYSSVDVYYGDGKKTGKTTFNYYAAKDMFASYEQRPTNLPTVPTSLNGKLSSQVEYVQNNYGEFTIIKKIDHFYKIVDKKRITAVNIDPVATSYGVGVCWSIKMHYYPIFSKWEQLVKSVVTTFNQADTLLNTVNSVQYQYNPLNFQASKITQINSKGEQIIEQVIYPTDYGSLTTSNAGIKNLVDNHIIAVPIEKVTIKQNADGSNARVIGGVITTFKPNSPLPDQAFTLENQNSIPLGNFDFSNSTTNLFSLNTTYRPKINYVSYTLKGNPVEINKINSIPITYLWGYDNTYPIAEIKNATYANVLAVLGQSTINQLASTPGTDAQVRQTLQVLRTDARLKGAMVTTYTYEPLVSMTSKTDENNITTFFEYDTFQRLKNARDLDGNIIKNYNYHYKGQP